MMQWAPVVKWKNHAAIELTERALVSFKHINTGNTIQSIEKYCKTIGNAIVDIRTANKNNTSVF